MQITICQVTKNKRGLAQKANPHVIYITLIIC